MTTKFRTLWLLGLIGLGVSVAGCGPVHHGDRNGQSCLDTQYFDVQWGVDYGQGTLPLSCSDIRAMGSSLLLLTNAAPPYDQLPVGYSLTCDDGAICSDRTSCNMAGTTASTIPVGTTILEADLLDTSGRVLSSAFPPGGDQRFTMYSCGYSLPSFIFAIR